MIASTDILQRILARKAEEIVARQAIYTIKDLEATAKTSEEPRGFCDAIATTIKVGKPAVIAELKKSSPSKGIIRSDFQPELIAESYARNGATCLSVLTDVNFFQGHNDYLGVARKASRLPTLRKDFIIDLWQVAESRAIGSDCILLIVAALEDSQISRLSAAAADYGMDVLLEVHDRRELERALSFDVDLIGINNRNLSTFQTRLETTLELIEHIPNGTMIVTESGIHSSDDVMVMRKAGIDTFLIGETLLRAPDPGAKLAELIQCEQSENDS